MELAKFEVKGHLHSFDGSMRQRNSNSKNNRMEGVALQRRNRTVSTGYDTFEASSATIASTTKVSIFESIHGGVDAILNAAAAVAQSGVGAGVTTTTATVTTSGSFGGNSGSDEGTTSDENSHGRPLKKYDYKSYFSSSSSCK